MGKMKWNVQEFSVLRHKTLQFIANASGFLQDYNLSKMLEGTTHNMQIYLFIDKEQKLVMFKHIGFSKF